MNLVYKLKLIKEIACNLHLLCSKQIFENYTHNCKGLRRSILNGALASAREESRVFYVTSHPLVEPAFVQIP